MRTRILSSLCWRFYGVWSFQSFLVLFNFFIQSFDKDRVFCCICIYFFQSLYEDQRFLFRAFTRISVYIVVFFLPKFVWGVQFLEFFFWICTFLLKAFKRKTRVFSSSFISKLLWGKELLVVSHVMSSKCFIRCRVFRVF